MDRNCWYQAEGAMVSVAGQNYTMAQFADYQAAYNTETHSFIGDPGLVDIAALDFHLKADSPCIDTGMNVDVPKDFEDASRPKGKAPDLGAYEYNGGDTPVK
jgi:hypothetical protein